MRVTIWQVDAFTTEPFKGNPAGVCVLDGPADETWMQNVALEMNLSETAFVYPKDDGFHLRWFTPACEVALCGHATLATAHTLWTEGFLKEAETARFYTLSGLLTADRTDDGWIRLDFPATPPTRHDPPEGLVEALGVTPVYVGKSRFDYLVEVADEGIVRGLDPDFNLLKRVEVRGTMVTAASKKEGLDFVSRFFAPAAGVNEDPVTGSAHCCLTPYWAEKLGKTEMSAFQASARGGSLRVRLAGDRVHLMGRAVTVFTAQWAS